MLIYIARNLRERLLKNLMKHMLSRSAQARRGEINFHGRELLTRRPFILSPFVAFAFYLHCPPRQQKRRSYVRMFALFFRPSVRAAYNTLSTTAASSAATRVVITGVASAVGCRHARRAEAGARMEGKKERRHGGVRRGRHFACAHTTALPSTSLL